MGGFDVESRGFLAGWCRQEAATALDAWDRNVPGGIVDVVMYRRRSREGGYLWRHKGGYFSCVGMPWFNPKKGSRFQTLPHGTQNVIKQQ